VQNSEVELRALIAAQAEAVRRRDVEGAIANYAPDVRLFDVTEPLQVVGREAAARRLREWFAAFRGAIGYELRDLTVVAEHEAAFCHSLHRVIGMRTDGTRLDMWWRATTCYRRENGKWTVTHEHSSVPFNPASGTASLRLKPSPAN
jgi:ketosteroid isomerase-like protein